MQGYVIWFTGLSGSGKSTLAAMLAAKLQHHGIHTEVLDGDVVRKNLSKGLGFSKEDRDTNVRRIGFVANLIARSGGCALTAAISPYKSIRDEQRQLTDNFIEIYCHCPLDELIKRDPKGLYKKALAGEIKGFTGIDDPYEEPDNPDVYIDTSICSIEQSLNKILAKLKKLGVFIGGEARQKLPQPHGGKLVDKIESWMEFPQDSIDLDEEDYHNLIMIADGTFSPLTGFMNQKDYLKVYNEMRLENGLVWAKPITLSVDDSGKYSVGQTVTLKYDSKNIGILEISDIYEVDGISYLGGDIQVKSWQPQSMFHYNPQQLRGHIQANRWSKVAAYQTSRPMNRADEYITKCVLETCDGLLIHSEIKGDVPCDIRASCHKDLVENHYPRNKVMMPEIPMSGDTDRDILHKALVHKNFGCSHFIVNRKTSVFDKFLKEEIGITPLCFGTIYCNKAGDIGSVNTLPKGALTPLEVQRPEVAGTLDDYHKFYENKKYRAVVFDLDGTLAESKSKVSLDIANKLDELRGVYHVGVISGAAWKQFEVQLIPYLTLAPDMMPTCGATYYKYSSNTGWSKVYQLSLTDDEKTKITSSFQKALEATGTTFDKIHGDQIEDRESQITFSALGQEAPLNEKEKWDPSGSKRKEIIDELKKLIPEFEIRFGGTTSIDVTKPGIDKVYGITKFLEQNELDKEDVLFIGDALQPGGNDYPVKEFGLDCIEVSGPKQTLEEIEKLLDNIL